MYTFKQLQDEHATWLHRNFPGAQPYKFLLGVMEELGELCHAQLKSELGIRRVDPAAWDIKMKDAVADIIIFLAGYCTSRGYDLQEIVESTWTEVKQRDWIADPVNGQAMDKHTSPVDTREKYGQHS